MDRHVETGRESTLSAALSASHWEISGLGLLTGCVEGHWGWEAGRREGKRNNSANNCSAVCQEHDILFERFLAAGTGAASVQLGLHLRHRHCKQQPSAPPCRCVTAVWCWVVRNSCSEVCMGKRAVCHTHGNKSWFWCFLGIVEQCGSEGVLPTQNLALFCLVQTCNCNHHPFLNCMCLKFCRGFSSYCKYIL